MKIGKMLKISISAILSLAVIASMLIIPAVSAETTTDYNLIQNGDFSELTDTFAASWNKTGDTVDITTASALEITDNGGENFLRVQSSSWGYAYQQGITVEPNTQYMVVFDYYVKGWVSGFWKYGYHKDKIIEQVQVANKTNGGVFVEDKWSTYSKTITTAADQTTFGLVFTTNGGRIYVDNVSVKKVVNITATAETGGTVAGLPSTVVQGDSITLKATANKGYTVDGWYNGDKKVTDSAIYTFTATEDADLTARFTAATTHIADNGFEDETLNAGWQNANDILSVTSAQANSGDQSLYIAPASAKSATYTFNVEPNTYYTVSEYVRLGTKSGAQAAIIKVTTTANTSTSLLDYANNNNIWLNAGGQATSSTWKKQSNTFYSGDNTELVLILYGGTSVEMYVDDIVIQKRFEITTATTEGGTVSGTPTSLVLEGTSVTLSATPNAGYLFDGWYNGDTLVSLATPYTFAVTGNTALTAKFIADDGENLIVNGSFEGALVSGWDTKTYPDFTSVKATDKGVTPIDGERVLDITKAAENWYYNYMDQNVAIESGKNYVVSFWAYRPTTSDVIIYKIGTASNNTLYSNGQKFLNTAGNIAYGKWVYVKVPFTAADDTFQIVFSSNNGTVYIDGLKLVKADDIGNLIENGDMSNTGKALNAWTVGDSSLFIYEAEAEGYTGTGALKIVGNGTDDWKNIVYTLSVKANTDYKIDFWARNTSADERMIYKVLASDGITSLIGGDKNTNGSGESDGEWGYNCIAFNTGENTQIKILFVERMSGTTYIDDIYVGERIVTDVASSNEALGTVSASKAYVGEDDEVTYTATATAGGKFLGWRVGDSETLVEGETYTYKGFDDITLTAVFEAALGNVNGDSAIDVGDMAALRGSILGTADYTALGDMNNSGANDIRDLVALYKAISK